jgi:putative transposase
VGHRLEYDGLIADRASLRARKARPYENMRCRVGVLSRIREFYRGKLFGSTSMKRSTSKYYQRRSLRLSGYDYSRSGLYFVTICIQHRECLLGKVDNQIFEASEPGKIVEQGFANLALEYPEIAIDAWVVMPNHVHFILEIGTQSLGSGRPLVLGELVRQFKYDTTKQINQLRDSPGMRVWQRNYYEHIIRNETADRYIRHYITQNPARWTLDQLHPENPSKW